MIATQLERIRETLARSDAVLFVGSGLSAWSGVPTWSQFVEELADFLDSQGESSDLVRAELRNKDLLQAAAYGFMPLTPPQQSEFLHQAVRWGIAEPSEAHRKLVVLPPRCFITTNYDRLLESALSLWRPGEEHPVFTVKNRVGLPTILQARATNFVFKPHGDVVDLDSIVLSRDHYRQLLGPNAFVLEALKALLLTRPVVFVGFGLRDPDFLLVQETLNLTYEGGVQNQFVLVREVHPDERVYWRDRYGLHLVPYARNSTDSGHEGLLDVLDALAARPVIELEAGSHDAEVSPEHALSLIRLATRYRLRTDWLDSHHLMPLRARSVDKRGPHGSPNREFDYALYPDLLLALRRPMIVTGPPGSGKTFGATWMIRQAALKLIDGCVKQQPKWTSLEIPLVVDLRLYSGDLEGMVQSELPPELSVYDLATRSTVRIVLDGVNEVPREFVETKRFEMDLARLLEQLPADSPLTILDRTGDALKGFDVPVVELDQIDRRWLNDELTAAAGRISEEIVNVLARPLFFNLYKVGLFDLDEVRVPGDIYAAYFARLDLTVKPVVDMPVTTLLGTMGFEMVSDGTQVAPHGWVLQHLERVVESPEVAADIANALLEAGFLIPVAGSAVMFPHHTFLEFLAAVTLARTFAEDTAVLDDVLRHTRWNHVLLLAASLLPASDARRYLRRIVEVDPAVAFRALRYLDSPDPVVVGELFRVLLEIPDVDMFLLDHLIEDAPVQNQHAQVLRRILHEKDEISEGAAILLLKLEGSEGMDEIVDLLFERRSDFNSTTRLARALTTVADRNLVKRIVERALDLEAPADWSFDDDGAGAHVADAVGHLLAALDEDEVISLAGELDQEHPAVIEFVARWLWEHFSPVAFRLAADMVRGHVEAAIFPCYGQIEFGSLADDEIAAEADPPLIAAIVAQLDRKDTGRWAAAALIRVARRAPATREWLRSAAEDVDGLARDFLTWVGSEDGPGDFLIAARSSILARLRERGAAWWLVAEADPAWSDNLDVFEQMLREGSPELLKEVLQDLQGRFPAIRLQDPVWWLRRVADVYRADDFAGHMLGKWFGTTANGEIAKSVLVHFPDLPREDAAVVARHIIPSFTEVSVADAPKRTVELLLEDISGAR